MRKNLNVIAAYSIMMTLIILVGIFQSWNVALSIFNLCLISAVMTMGANIQWGYAGLINFGIMGYTALGGLAAVLVSVPPVREAWQVGGFNMILCAFLIVFMVFSIRFIMKKYNQNNKLINYDNSLSISFKNGYYEIIRFILFDLLKNEPQKKLKYINKYINNSKSDKIFEQKIKIYLTKIFEKEENEAEKEKNINSTLLLEPDNEEAMYMLIDIKLEKSDIKKVEELRGKFKVICNSLCFKIDSIDERLSNIDVKNES